MNTQSQPRLRLYALALRLHPAAFRARYADEMLDIARHEYASSPHPLRFAAALASDTLHSLLREHLRAATPARPGYVAAFALFFSFLLLAAAIFSQQILRRGVDRQPARLAETIARTSPQDPTLAATLAAPKQEISSPAWLKSSEPLRPYLRPLGPASSRQRDPPRNPPAPPPRHLQHHPRSS